MNLIQILPHYLLIDGILDDLKKFIADQLYKTCERLCTESKELLNFSFSNLNSDLTNNPQSYAAQAYSLIFNIQQSVITPIAGLILTFIFCYEMIQLVQARNAMQDIGSWDIWKVILKTAAAIVFVTHAMEICMAFFDLVSYIIHQSSGLMAKVNVSSSVDQLLNVAKKFRDEKDIGSLISTVLASAISVFITGVIYCAAIFVAISRMIEIYIMASVAPLTMGAIFNKEFNSMPINYLKNMFSLALQGFFMLIVVALHGALASRFTISSESVWVLTGSYALSGLVLIALLFKCRDFAKAAIGMM
jgi:hypothetical protein